MITDIRGYRVTRDLPEVAYSADDDPDYTITIRLPRHTAAQLADQAHDARTSFNQFCLSKLIAAVPECLILTRPTPKRLREVNRSRKATK